MKVRTLARERKLAMPDASTLTFDNTKNQRYKALNAVKFGGLSYAQNFVICTGLYISNRSKTIIDHLPFSETNEAILIMCKKICDSPTKISSRGQMENQTYHGVVLDHDLQVRPRVHRWLLDALEDTVCCVNARCPG